MGNFIAINQNIFWHRHVSLWDLWSVFFRLDYFMRCFSIHLRRKHVWPVFHKTNGKNHNVWFKGIKLKVNRSYVFNYFERHMGSKSSVHENEGYTRSLIDESTDLQRITAKNNYFNNWLSLWSIKSFLNIFWFHTGKKFARFVDFEVWVEYDIIPQATGLQCWWEPSARRAATLCRALSELSGAKAWNEQIKQF